MGVSVLREVEGTGRIFAISWPCAFFGSPFHSHSDHNKVHVDICHLAQKHVSSSRTSKPPPPTPRGLAPDSVRGALRARPRDEVACAAEEVEFERGRGFRVGDQFFLAALYPGTGPVLFFGPCAWRSALRPPCPHPSLLFSNFSSFLFILIVPTPCRERMSSPLPSVPVPPWRLGGRKLVEEKKGRKAEKEEKEGDKEKETGGSQVVKEEEEKTNDVF